MKSTFGACARVSCWFQSSCPWTRQELAAELSWEAAGLRLDGNAAPSVVPGAQWELSPLKQAKIMIQS